MVGGYQSVCFALLLKCIFLNIRIRGEVFLIVFIFVLLRIELVSSDTLRFTCHWFWSQLT